MFCGKNKVVQCQHAYSMMTLGIAEEERRR
jgi:hypothetical protein